MELKPLCGERLGSGDDKVALIVTQQPGFFWSTVVVFL